MAAYSLLFHSTTTGRGARGGQVVREIAPLVEDPRVSATHRIHWRFAVANRLLRFGDPREALATMDEALAQAAADGLKIEGVIRRHRIGHLLTLGRLDEAEAELERLSLAPRVEPYFELRAWLAWQRGRYRLALDEAHEALRQATLRGRTIYSDLDRALLAAICASSGQARRGARASGTVPAGHGVDWRVRGLPGSVGRGPHRARARRPCGVPRCASQRPCDRQRAGVSKLLGADAGDDRAAPRRGARARHRRPNTAAS